MVAPLIVVAAHIERRRADVAHITLSPRPTLPDLDEPCYGELVVGSVVMGADYIRQVVGAWRNVIGGEIRSFTPVLDQARAESSLRMLEAANAKERLASSTCASRPSGSTTTRANS